MKDELQNKIISLIEKGEGIAPEIAAELLSQAFVTGLIMTIAGFIFTCVGIVAAVFFRKCLKDREGSSDKLFAFLMGMILGNIIGVALICDGTYRMFEVYLWPNSYILKAIMGGS